MNEDEMREYQKVNAGEYDPELVGRTFLHFKGKKYQLLAYAKDSETCEIMVVYRLLYGDGGVWVRPAKMFFERITHHNQLVSRFTPIQ